MKKKKRGPQDLTLINLRASKARLKALKEDLDLRFKIRLGKLERRVKALEQWVRNLETNRES